MSHLRDLNKRLKRLKSRLYSRTFTLLISKKTPVHAVTYSI